MHLSGQYGLVGNPNGWNAVMPLICIKQNNIKYIDLNHIMYFDNNKYLSVYYTQKLSKQNDVGP